MALLELEEIRAGYGIGPDILGGVSLELEEGRSYCLIGPNGAGKSTLLKTVAGLLPPRSGRLIYDGRSMGGIRPDLVLASGICYVPQDRSLFPDMSVRENLVMGGFLERDRGVVRDRMKRVFELFPLLEERSAQNAGTLSGGEQQMLALGRALMVEPRLLMIDEPSLGLAPKVADQIFSTIGSLSRLGITLLLVEQNVQRGLECTEWAFLLDLGSVVFHGPSETILEDPRIRELYLGSRPTTGVAGETADEETAGP